MKWLKPVRFLGVALLLACQNNDKAAELAAKEQQLAAKEQQLKEEALAAREQAVALREQSAARVAAVTTPAPEVPPEASAAGAAAPPVQPARAVAAAPEVPPTPPVQPVPRPVLLSATVTVDMLKPDGQQWDGLGDAPDPLITATVQRSGQSATSLTKNALNATASLQLNLQVGDTILINVVDKDLSAHDPIGSFSVMYFGGPTPQGGKLGAGSIAVNFSGPMTD
jgi:outer membrane murein-binding lipoprotein Lpp